MVGGNLLRWYVAQANTDELIVEATTYEAGLKQLASDQRRFYPGKSVVLNVVPTGIGCTVGGFAGDAAPACNLLAGAADYLVANPNTVNASNFINLQSPNIIYTDGYSIDLFCKGDVDLHIPYANRVGLIVEKADDQSLDAVFNIVNAVRAIHGVDIVDVVVTEESIGGRCHENQSKGFVGTVDNPQVLLSACEQLVASGANAIAMTTNIADLPLENYALHFEGAYPNPVGGVEAVMSYLVTNHFTLPSAHAPMINLKQLDLKRSVVDARGAGEFASESGLACILIGLRNAPQICPTSRQRIADVINVHNLAAVVTPASCLGGIPAVYAQWNDIPVIAVRSNETVLRIDREVMEMHNVIEVENYAEAVGILHAIRKGICIDSIRRPLSTIYR
jgi:Protein of unknown function (DUF3326)